MLLKEHMLVCLDFFTSQVKSLVIQLYLNFSFFLKCHSMATNRDLKCLIIKIGSRIESAVR